MINIFVSYSHKDEIFKDELYSHLYPLTQNERYSVNLWIDTFIQPSDKWDDTIKSKLNQADIILLLVSADFLSSYYINMVEMQHAISMHIAGELIVIPVILRHCDWKDEGLYISKIQAYPKDGKPVTDWLRKDEAYLDVILKLKFAVNNILSKRKGQEIEDFTKRLDLLKEYYTERYEKSVKALSVTPTLEKTLLELFEQSYYNTFNKLQELIDKFVPGDIIISFDQMKDFYNRMTDDTYVSFVALTHYRDWEYWKSSASKYWLNGNKELIKRQKKVERTFVIESK